LFGHYKRLRGNFIANTKFQKLLQENQIMGELSITLARLGQGFQSGPVPGTFTRLRSCMVPAEITEPPKISGGQNHKYDRLVEYFS
jgi:hypothetical protein